MSTSMETSLLLHRESLVIHNRFMFIDNDIFGSYKNKSEAWIFKNNPSFHSFVFSLFDIGISWREKFYLYHNNLSFPPICYCGGKLKFIGLTKGYRQYCSGRCKARDPILNEIVKQKNLEKWGVDNPMKADVVKDNHKQSIISKYGVSNISKLQETKKKVAETNLERYGVNYLSQLSKNKHKASLSMSLKSDRLNSLKNELLKERITKRVSNFGISFIEFVKTSQYKMLCPSGHEFEIHKTMLNDRTRNQNTICTICNPISHGSDAQKQLYDYISVFYQGEIRFNSRYSQKYEIDIFLPEMNIGFEFNGLWWHSSKYKSRKYHQDKLDYFESRGIRIFYIWEDDWIFKRDYVLSSVREVFSCDILLSDFSIVELNEYSIGIIIGSELRAFIEYSLVECEVVVRKIVGSVHSIKKLTSHLQKKYNCIQISTSCSFLSFMLDNLGFGVYGQSSSYLQPIISNKRIGLTTLTSPILLSKPVENITAVWMNSLKRWIKTFSE